MNKGLFSSYNHLNLPSHIELFGPGGIGAIDYSYDALGTKLRKTVKEGTVAEQVTDYVGGLVYQAGRLQFVPTSEGRILPPALSGTGGWAYEYHLKDHLGNLRVPFRLGETTVQQATMEASPEIKAREECQFAYLTDAIRDPNGCIGGGVKLSSQHPLGPMRLIKVSKGDVVTAKVKGWYDTPAKNNGGRSLGLLFQAFPKDNLSSDQPGQRNPPRLSVGLTLNAPGKAVPTDAPKAYLQLQAYNEEGEAAGQQTRFVASQDCMGELLIEGYQVTEDGYLRIYLANESDAPAYFDQLEISHQQAMIVQEQHYLAFGLEMKGIEYEGNPELHHRWKYNGKEFQTDLGLNWNNYGARMYDPQIGRWHVVDPLAELGTRWSPYVYGFNNPLHFVDPDGRWPFPPGWKQAARQGIEYLSGKAGDNKLAQFGVGLLEGGVNMLPDAYTDSKDMGQQLIQRMQGAAEGVSEGDALKVYTNVDGVAATAVGLAQEGKAVLDGDTRAVGRLTVAVGAAVAGGLTEGLKGRKAGGAFTEPKLPSKTIASQDGADVVHYTKSGDHGPPHVHVIGGGPDTRVGQARKALDGSPKPTGAQQKVLDDNKSAIRKAVDQIGRYFNYNRQ